METSNNSQSVVRTYQPTSEATIKWFFRNGYQAEDIPALAKDAVPMMQAHIDAQRARRAGPPTTGKYGQVAYLLAHGWTKAQIDRMTFGEASALIYKSKKAKGLLRA
jgi:hypothetical protein